MLDLILKPLHCSVMYRMFTLTTSGDVEVLGGVRVDSVRRYKSVSVFLSLRSGCRRPQPLSGGVSDYSASINTRRPRREVRTERPLLHTGMLIHSEEQHISGFGV